MQSISYSNLRLVSTNKVIILYAMDIVCFRPREEANFNDTFVEWGIKVLLTEVLGSSVRFHEVYFEPLDSKKIPDHDLFVLCGTPWIWDRCTLSAKYLDLATVLSACEAPKIALGIGACFPLGFKCNTVRRVNSAMPGLSDILQHFSGISVRDKFARRVCDLLKIRANLLCCPAVFAKEHFCVNSYKPDKDILFFYAPQLGLSAGVLSKDFVQHYLTLQVNYARSTGAEVICINRDEEKAALELGLDAELMRNPAEVANKIATARTLLSGRVHGCMFTLGLPVSAALLPVDTRYLSYQYCGGRIIMTDKVSSISPDNLRRCRFNYNKEKKKWKKFLKHSLESAGLC